MKPSNSSLTLAYAKGIFSRMRARFWTGILTLLASKISVANEKGKKIFPSALELPEGPLILVANHSSHIDSAILSAVIGNKRNVLFVAGGEYWSGSKFKSFSGRYLAGLFLVRKGKDGWEDLLNATPTINDGTILVIFPEGTRTRDGEVGKFHSGAFRLACVTGAKILPVGLIGCREMLPVHGRYKRGPLGVRFGSPISITEENIVESISLTREKILQMIGKR